MSDFINELRGIQKNLKNDTSINFDAVAKKMYQEAVNDVVEGIKHQARTTVRHHPSLRTINGEIRLNDRGIRKVMVFNGEYNKNSSDYTVGPSNRWSGIDEVQYYHKSGQGTIQSSLIFKELYNIKFERGLFNKSYSMQMTPLGRRFLRDIEILCGQSGIKVNFCCEFRMWFKGNELLERVAPGHPLQPRAFGLEEMARCISLVGNYSVRL
ncbi:MAG: hypothetical protein E7253_00900 [Lachnospiraceae bacterium]|nr:hypothetical protein [Lachnospiraceae bacterium]